MENENSSAIIKETLYDKVFKPQKITLANGHSVLRRRSRTPLIVLLSGSGHIPFTGDDRL